MTDAETDALARDILNEVLANLSGITSQVCTILRKQNGDPFIELVGASKAGYGSFRFTYDPLPLVKTLLARSEQLYDALPVTITEKETGQTSTKALKEYPSEDRDKFIRFMALCASMDVIGALFPKLGELLDERFKDGEIIAEGALSGMIAHQLETEDGIGHVNTDMSDTVQNAVKRVSERKHKYLREHLSAIPHLIAQRGRGAPTKSPFTRQVERQKFLADVEGAYRALRMRTGKIPTKTDVARELGIGGDPKRGGQSALQVFNAKLKRHSIDYKDLVAKIEEDIDK